MKKENIKMKKITDLFAFIFDILLPPRCLICRQTVYKQNGLCPKCFNTIHFLSNQSCPVCGRPYTFPVENSKQLICAKCLSKPPKLSGLKAVFAYDDFSKPLILQLKHADRTDVVPYLTKLMYQRGKDFLSDCDYIIPVPLHWQRLVKRKYNQAALLAMGLEKLSKKKCLLTTLTRVKKTASQGHKNKDERKQNIKDAFQLIHPENIKGKSIVLVDDVYTTGSTLNECAKILIQAGAKSVRGLVVARVCFFE